MRRTFYSSRGDRALVEALDRGLREGGHAAALKEAADLLAGRARDSYVHALLVAQLYTAAGDADNGVDWLEIAVEQRDPNIPYVGIIPGFWKLHEHPRFRKLVQEIGVPLRKPAGR